MTCNLQHSAYKPVAQGHWTPHSPLPAPVATILFSILMNLTLWGPSPEMGQEWHLMNSFFFLIASYPQGSASVWTITKFYSASSYSCRPQFKCVFVNKWKEFI